MRIPPTISICSPQKMAFCPKMEILALISMIPKKLPFVWEKEAFSSLNGDYCLDIDIISRKGPFL